MPTSPLPFMFHTENDTAALSAAIATWHSKACVPCRLRKVKCDRQSPCGACLKVGMECVFPSPLRTCRRHKKGDGGRTSVRERRKEVVYRSRGGHIDVEDHRAGRLVVERGRSGYISDGFWASLDNATQAEDLRLTCDAGEKDSSTSTAESVLTSLKHSAFPFSPSGFDLRFLHPSQSQIWLFWQVYLENVDPVIKILHKPTMENVIAVAKDDLNTLDQGTGALLFAIYFASVTSMPPADVGSTLGGDKKAMTVKYRCAVEQALMNANFLTTQELTTLQAFILYLVCLCRNDDTKLVWTLTGLAFRLAQSLGLHHDGTQFGLSPFETEMRRRLWWQLCLLDERSSEDHGSDSTATEMNFDTKLPLNINDSDLHHNAVKAPEEHEGRTDVTFSLVRYEILIKECHQWLETKYLKYCPGGGPVYWLAENMARMVIAKRWLTLHQPLHRPNGAETVSREMRDRLFLASIQIIERSRQLETDSRARKWRWLIQTYFQWLPIALVLGELCIRTQCEVVDRAWRAVADVLSGWPEATASSSNGIMLEKLMKKAKRNRDEESTTRQWNVLTSANNTLPTFSRRETHETTQNTHITDRNSNVSTSSNTIESFPSSSFQIPSVLAPWSLNDSMLLGDMGVTDTAV